jgi:hypothetical protein
MTINKRNKNRVLVNEIEYLWWVFDEYDQTEFDGIQVKVVCSNQVFFFKYGLEQADNKRYIVLALNNYVKLVHLSCPKFENQEGVIIKSEIIKLIEWCKKEKQEIIYALDGHNNKLSNNEKYSILKDLQDRIA